MSQSMDEKVIMELAEEFRNLGIRAKEEGKASTEMLINMADDIQTMPDQAERLLKQHNATLRKLLGS